MTTLKSLLDSWKSRKVFFLGALLNTFIIFSRDMLISKCQIIGEVVLINACSSQTGSTCKAFRYKKGLSAGFHSEKTYRFCPIKSHRYDNIISRTGNVLLTSLKHSICAFHNYSKPLIVCERAVF